MGLPGDLKDLQDIQTLKHNYARYYDGNEMDKLADLFCTDAICQFGERFGGDWVGQDMIRQRYHSLVGDRPCFAYMHSVTNPVIDLHGDTAHGRWYLLDMALTREGDNPLILVGIYDEDYKRIGGEWKISRTRIDYLWPNRTI